MSRDSSTAADLNLDAALVDLAVRGWQLQHRTPTTMQVVKPKRFKGSEGVLLAIVCIALVVFAGVLGILLALLLAAGDFIWYAARRDETMLVAVGADGRVRPVGARAPNPTVCACTHIAKLHGDGTGACVYGDFSGACPCRAFRPAC